MPTIDYLGKTVELTIEEYNKIMVQCPNLTYITKSGHKVKGSDSTLLPISCPTISNELGFYKCLKTCSSSTSKNCTLRLNFEKNSTIVLKDNNYSSDFSNLNVSIKSLNNIFGTLKISGQGASAPPGHWWCKGLTFNSLDISGVNIYAHDVMGCPALRILAKNTIKPGLTITNGNHKFYNNDNTSGGPIYVEHSDISLINTIMEFTNTSPATRPPDILYPSTIWAGNGTLSIEGKKTNLKFISNKGGVIFTKNLIINDGNIYFANNYNGQMPKAVGSRGAIYSTNYTKIIDSSITFFKNSAGRGAAIYSGSLSIIGKNTNITFSSNIAGERSIAGSIQSASGDGGAIYTENSLIIDTSGKGFIEFYNNIVDGYNWYKYSASSQTGGGAITSLGNIELDTSMIVRYNYLSGIENGLSTPAAYTIYTTSNIYIKGGTYHFYRNGVQNPNFKPNKNISSTIYANNIYVMDNSKTRLKFEDNRASQNIITLKEGGSFDTSLACPTQTGKGCSNIYTFHNNSNSDSLIRFGKDFYMAGGIWDFSNNSLTQQNNITHIKASTNGKISIRYADISFDTTLAISNCIADVSKNPTASTMEEKYYWYTMDKRTIHLSDDTARTIKNNSHSIV